MVKLSLIVCARTPNVSAHLQKNVADTIGVDYEWIVIDNSRNEYTIFTAYNEGVKRAKGSILCFMHDDILYHTEGWGSKIVHHFEDSAVGLVGVAGTHFLPTVPTYWFTSPFVSEYNYTNDKGRIIKNNKVDFFGKEQIVDAVAVDGLCFFVRRDLFDVIRFDDTTFSGFHLYDMDICMQILQNDYKVCIVRDVLIEHYWSEESMNTGMEVFYANLDLFYAKWKDNLPISRGISTIPTPVLDRVNTLYIKADEARKVRASKTYRLGKILLYPIKLLKKKRR